MAKFKISGIWKGDDGVITHYAFHELFPENKISTARKIEKSAAVKILSDPINTAVTWLWDYQISFWKDGARVEVVAGRYLRSVHDNKLIDNLAHLINYDWL